MDWVKRLGDEDILVGSESVVNSNVVGLGLWSIAEFKDTYLDMSRVCETSNYGGHPGAL